MTIMEVKKFLFALLSVLHQKVVLGDGKHTFDAVVVPIHYVGSRNEQDKYARYEAGSE